MKVILFLSVLVLTSNLFADNGAEAFIVKFGALDDTREKIIVSNEYLPSQNIALSESNKFGFSISPNRKINYTFYTIAYLPNAPKILNGVLSQATADYLSGIKSIVGSSNEDMIVRFHFDEGDPLGIYRIELYVNDKKVKTVKFNVVASN